jgi:hypothetical protein
MATTAELRAQAGTNQGLAKQALERLEGLATELEGALANLTSDQIKDGEGNLGWYRHEVQARLLELRGTFAGLEAWQDDLDGYLAGIGVRRR